ncbi:MAG: hypothetical protein EOP83_33165 [Verrucomicrobiaceae bacterium]|nr:MAG: hypothetical protein EOP83_33165 [Verrucomicrobiaceae bacterium]
MNTPDSSKRFIVDAENRNGQIELLHDALKLMRDQALIAAAEGRHDAARYMQEEALKHAETCKGLIAALRVDIRRNSFHVVSN